MKLIHKFGKQHQKDEESNRSRLKNRVLVLLNPRVWDLSLTSFLISRSTFESRFSLTPHTKGMGFHSFRGRTDPGPGKCMSLIPQRLTKHS